MSRLVHQTRKGVRSTMLHIYDKGSLNSVSGIRATIFGATGFLGPYVG